MNKKYESVKVDKETHDILKRVNYEQGISMLAAMRIAVKEKYNKKEK